MSAAIRAPAVASPEYLASFDPAKGFKPAQSDLTAIFLQLAGSLECYGTPEPYLRHMKAEHERIEAKYTVRFGAEPKHFCPPYMTDEYLDRFSANWTLLAPKLGLDSLARNTGNLVRAAINGTRGTGTMLVDIFNEHQARVYASMMAKGSEPADFEAFQAELVRRLEIGKRVIHSENYEIPQRDAVDFTIGIQGRFTRLFEALDKGAKPADAERLKAFVIDVCEDVGKMAQSELQAGIIETALDRAPVARPANAQ